VGRAEQVTELIKAHDSKLYCDRGREGKLCIYRKSTRVERYEIDGVSIGFVRPAPHFVMALTDNWQMHGREVDWGLIPILQRLQSMDLWNRNLAEDLIEGYEKKEKQVARDASNKNEDFLREFRKPFAETFKDVNTANMKKIDKRRLQEKKIWQS